MVARMAAGVERGLKRASSRVPAFFDTMPRRYQQLFNGPTVQEHAAISRRRGSAPAHAEIWRRLPQGAAIVCLVADDRSGVVSHLGTALATRSIDLLGAHVYFRRGLYGVELFKLLWLRRDEVVAPSLTEGDLARIVDLMGGLITGELRMDGRPSPRRRSPPANAATIVRFEPTDDARQPAILTLETLGRPGLFADVSRLLQGANATLVESRQSRGSGEWVTFRFLVLDADGKAPDQYRRGLLQSEILRLVEPKDRDVVMPAHFDSGVFDAGFGDRGTPAPL
jgi:UTP:GlnB (protein PII) uridylyltransferase